MKQLLKFVEYLLYLRIEIRLMYPKWVSFIVLSRRQSLKRKGRLQTYYEKSFNDKNQGVVSIQAFIR